MFKHDWNGNGRRDVVDEYIDYKMFEEITKKNNHSNNVYLHDDSKYELPKDYYSSKREKNKTDHNDNKHTVIYDSSNKSNGRVIGDMLGLIMIIGVGYLIAFIPEINGFIKGVVLLLTVWVGIKYIRYKDKNG